MAGRPAKLLGLFGYGNMNVALDKIAKRRGTPHADGPTSSTTTTRPTSPCSTR